MGSIKLPQLFSELMRCAGVLISCRLGWPELLDHPFVRETAAERLKRERALADAVELADSSRAWKVRQSLHMTLQQLSLYCVLHEIRMQMLLLRAH
jgi:hypothetical protein